MLDTNINKYELELQQVVFHKHPRMYHKINKKEYIGCVQQINKDFNNLEIKICEDFIEVENEALNEFIKFIK